jgi:CubicO group peptidase (beta-lactamase class C family)
VTLRHLLGHTSGIAELIQMQELRAMQLMRNPTVTRNDVYKVINRQPFQFPRGTMEIYSNTNFWLLGLVVERASGMTYEDYVEKRIFEPLGMTRSKYCNSAENVPRRAYGYGMKGGLTGRVRDIVHTGTDAAGALCSTAGDMLTWLQALHGGRVLAPSLFRRKRSRRRTLRRGAASKPIIPVRRPWLPFAHRCSMIRLDATAHNASRT